MFKTKKFLSLLLTLALILSLASPVWAGSDENKALWDASIKDAITADDSEILPLVEITPASDMVTWNKEKDKVLMISWNKYPDSYPKGATVELSWGTLWTFTADEIAAWYEKNKAQTTDWTLNDWTLRLEQLIGLPENKGYTHFTAMWIDPDDMVRPAYVTDITKQMDNEFPADIDQEYVKWFNTNSESSYKDESGYPWTRLGYTYDWADNGTEYGLSEFLVAQNSKVDVEFTLTTEDFIKWLAAPTSIETGANTSQSTDPAAADTSIFTDVPATAWYYDDVNAVNNAGIMTGTTDSTFTPSGKITRAMFITMLWRMQGSPVIDKEQITKFLNLYFDDVSGSEWFTPALIWGYYNGIIKGSSDSNFNPKGELSRQDMAVILYRYYNMTTPLTEKGSLSSQKWTDLSADFSDWSSISDYCKNAMLWATANKIITGKTSNMIDPKGKTSRAEAAAIINRSEAFSKALPETGLPSPYEISQKNTLNALLSTYNTVTYRESALNLLPENNTPEQKRGVVEYFSKDTNGSIRCMWDNPNYFIYSANDTVAYDAGDSTIYGIFIIDKDYSGRYTYDLYDENLFTNDSEINIVSCEQKENSISLTLSSPVTEDSGMSLWDADIGDTLLSNGIIDKSSLELQSAEYSVVKADGTSFLCAKGIYEFNKPQEQTSVEKEFLAREKTNITVVFEDNSTLSYQLPKGEKLTVYIYDDKTVYTDKEGTQPYVKDSITLADDLTLYCYPNK